MRVDVWGDVQTPAGLMRGLAREQPDLVVELSMRRDLGKALVALERHELDLAFGNVDNLDRALSAGLSAELITTDPIAVLVNERSVLAERAHATPADLARHGIWLPLPGSSQELRAFAEEYARSIGASLRGDSPNVGLDALVERVAFDPASVTLVVATWPLPAERGVRVVALRPTPHYPWYAVRRTAAAHPSLPRVLRSLRTEHPRPAATEDVWLPRATSARDPGTA